MAQDRLEQILNAFNNRAYQASKKIDPKREQKQSRQSSGRHLSQSVARMMHIETECFKIQRDFLETGTP